MASEHYCLAKPMEEIRLLDTLDRSPSGTLSGRIQRVAVHELPPFVSVSHVWGHEQAVQPMHIRSGCGDRAVTISCNLESFFLQLLRHSAITLPRLWRGGSRLPVWVDMTCINQTDTREKSYQIPLMREIYSQASVVFVWIHEHNIQLTNAFHYLRQMSVQQQTATDADVWRQLGPCGWHAVKKFLACEWFERRWTVQEAVLPQHTVFLCGSDTLTMSELFDGIDILLTALKARPKEVKLLDFATIGAAHPVSALRRLKEVIESHHEPSLLWLLEIFRFTHSTLASDQVYALLALCSTAERAGTAVDYDLEAHEVYQRATINHARHHRNLEFLALCTPAQRQYPNNTTALNHRPNGFVGPSWVPNWQSSSLRRCLGPHNLVDGQNPFKASQGLEVNHSFIGGQLIVSGFMIDRIQSLGQFCSPDRRSELSDPNSALFEDFFTFWMTSDITITPYRNALNRARVFARTLSLLGVWADPLPHPEDVPRMFYRWCKKSILGERLRSCDFHAGSIEGNKNQKGFVRMKRLLSWVPFVTQRGYIGLAREQCSEGDEIWIISGCSVPVLLSPLGAAMTQYEVRGEVFLDGAMFGEMVDQLESQIETVHLV